MSQKSREEQARAEFERLSETLRKLSGAGFLRAAWSYGDELGIDIADEGHGTPDGSLEKWTLTTRASRWLLLSPSRLVAHDRDPKDSELTVFGTLEGTTIRTTEARFEDYALTVTFSNDYRFVVLTSQRRRMKYAELALWQLFTPYNIVIDVQPNGDIDFVPGHIVDDQAYIRQMRGR
jgi:hypothetical protein